MNNQQVEQQKKLANIAVIGTVFIWLTAMVLSYESQVEFALSIGLTSTIFSVPKAYALPILTDSVILVSATWSLLATLQGLPTIKYRIAMLFFGCVTVWFNAHSIKLSEADYTTIFTISWIPFMVIVSTEMLLSHFQQQVKLQRDYIGKDNELERRMMKIETLVELGRVDEVVSTKTANALKKQLNGTQEKSLNYTSPVTGDEEIEKIQEIQELSPLDKAKAVKAAKYEEELAKTLVLLNQGHSTEYIADMLDVAPKTVLNRKEKLNGRVNPIKA